MFVSVCVCREKDRWREGVCREITALLHLCYTFVTLFILSLLRIIWHFVRASFLAFFSDSGFHSRIFAANSSNMNDISEYLDSCHVDLSHISDCCLSLF